VLGERHMLLNGRQIVNEPNAEKLILLAIEDITERKEAEKKLEIFSEELEAKVKEQTGDLEKSNAELKGAVKELKQTNDELDQFTSLASHDLQEPLRKIITFTGRLQEKYVNDLPVDAKTLFNKIENASNRMRHLVDDLLNYSLVSNHEKVFTQINLNETLKNILTDFELLIEQKQAEITSDALPTIEAIPVQMNQLFYNLISNAFKFLKEEEPHVISITSKTVAQEEIKKYPQLNARLNYCEIIFEDNGIGFDQKNADQIFGIFQRLHDTKIYPGTGIGLALCKKIIENHGGEIFATSKENEGAAFHVILPLKH
jgi:two-component system CheB/CheR fusion protein